jgi:hypothetical protein
LASVRASLPLLAVGFVVFCLVDLVRAEKVRYLPKWARAILCMGPGLTIPFGGILYLAIGKGPLSNATACTALSSAPGPAVRQFGRQPWAFDLT